MIGIGAASSIPQFNLKEVNNALIKLLWNPDIDFDEIYCAPDFATGGILLNNDEVKESLKNGTGKSCRLRSVIEYDDKERTLIVKEIPYGVYTNTICAELVKIIESPENPGIDSFNDFTGINAEIEIYLRKTANADKVLRYLYKNTSLQSYYTINLTMLDQGRFPLVFGWREALQAHLDHEVQVYTRGYQFDLDKIEARLHIIKGLLIAMASIEEVIQTIKSSASTAVANQELQKKFLLDEVQAKAILDMKLSRLAHLEVEKLKQEQEKLISERDRITEIINNKDLLYAEIEKGLKAVASKYGDERRTKVMNLSFSKDADEDPIEEKELNIYLTNEGNLYTSESSTLYTQKRGGKGAKIKMDKGEYIITSETSSNANVLLAFSNEGKVYSLNLADFPLTGRVNIGEFFILEGGEKLTNIVACGKVDKYQSVVFVTKNGMIKKTDFSEYKVKKSKGVIAIKLKDDDAIISTMFCNDEKIGFLTKDGNCIIIDIENINSTGRATSGVKGIKLSAGDYVVDARKVKSTAKEIISITEKALISRTDIEEFGISNRATKGSKIQKFKEEDDKMSCFLPINDKAEISVVSNRGIIAMNLSDINKTSKGAIGNIAKKLAPKEKIINLM